MFIKYYVELLSCLKNLWLSYCSIYRMSCIQRTALFERKHKEVFVNLHSYFSVTLLVHVLSLCSRINVSLIVTCKFRVSFLFLMTNDVSVQLNKLGFWQSVSLCLWAQDTCSDVWEITIFVNVDHIIEVLPGSSPFALAVLMYKP